MQYLCGDGVLSGLSTSKASGGFVGSHYSSSSYQNKPASDYLNYSSSLPPKQPVTNIEPQLNFTTSYGSGSLYNEQKYATNKTPLMGSNYSGSGRYYIRIKLLVIRFKGHILNLVVVQRKVLETYMVAVMAMSSRIKSKGSSRVDNIM